MEKQERKQKKILTENRLTTVNKRETSFEGLVSQLENGEDGVYNLITENKNTIFQPKVTITKKDLEEIPELRQLREAIELWEKRSKVVSGREAWIVKKALIEMRKDQYVIKNGFRKPIVTTKLTRSKPDIKLDENEYFTPEGELVVEGVSLMRPDVVSQILCNYSKLKQDSYDKFDEDMWYLIYSFEEISDKALEKYPILKRIMEYKIDGLQNEKIQELILEEFNVKHSVEYISSLWRKKIPKIIADAAIDEWMDWYYLTQERGKYKRCSKCGQIKLAHNRYFSKNKTSKDGFYSICKICRNKKKEVE